jgi:non-ribosomal peptide synthase protein (TIGR01720 family)
VDYWNKIEKTEFKLSEEENIESLVNTERHKYQFSMDKEKTEFLLKDANKPYNTDIQILLIAALILALEEYYNENFSIIELENYGRNIDNVDVSRTIGWFTAMYPVRFEIGSGDIGDVIKEVKEKIKKVPDNGIGYGVSKYLSANMIQSKKKKSDIRFNYLGQFGQELSNDLFSYNFENTGLEFSKKNRLTTKLDVNVMIIDGELKIDYTCCKELFKDSNILLLKEKYIYYLNEIINHLRNEDDVYFTPSDFDTANLDEADLTILFN